MSNRQSTDIGAAWLKTSKNGNEYISISFKPEAQQMDLANCFVSLMINNRKSNPKHPDYLMTAMPKDNAQRPPQQRQGAFPRPANHAPQNTQSQPPSWDDGDPGY